VENLILDKGFWKNILNCLRGVLPLIKVLRTVDSYEKPAMGFIYEEMELQKRRYRVSSTELVKGILPIFEF